MWRFFEISAENIAHTPLWELNHSCAFDEKDLSVALETLGIDVDAPDPARP